MSRLAVLALAAAAIPGCLFDSCPYVVDSISRSARSTARFDVANATLAEQVWAGLGFEASRDGLRVQAEQSSLQVIMSLDAGGTWMLVRDGSTHGEFRSHEEAQEHVDAHMADALRRINATVQAFEDRVDWPPFAFDPMEGSISVC
jgi:hypothetical protein